MDQPLIDLQESSVDPALTPSPHADSRSILTNDNHQPTTSTPTGGSLTPTGNDPELRTIHVGVTDAESVQPDKTEGLRWPWSKRDRLKRDTSMDKLDEEIEATKLLETSAPKAACPDYFGVRSYLHHFYDSRTYKDPDLYEDGDDSTRLLYPGSSTNRRCCTAVWWKIFVLVGIMFLLIGMLAVLVGYLIPQKSTVVGPYGAAGNPLVIIDREAIDYNQNLDICKLIGVILFCTGGLTLAVALMIPSFLYRYCDDDGCREAAFSVQSGDATGPLPTKCPLPTSAAVVPASEKLTGVQPARKVDEVGTGSEEGSTVTPYHDSTAGMTVYY